LRVETLTPAERGLLTDYVLRRSSRSDVEAFSLASRFALRLDHDLAGEAPEAFLARLVHLATGGAAGEPIANLDRLASSDQSLLREYLLRRPSLAPHAAMGLAERLAAALCRKLGHDLGPETAPSFLARVALQVLLNAERKT